VSNSSQPTNQLRLSRMLWPKHTIHLLFAHMVEKVMTTAVGRFTKRFLLYLQISLGIICRRQTVVSLSGPAIANTLELVIYLEQSGALSQSGCLIYRRNLM